MKNYILSIALILSFSLFQFSANAQSPVGKWKASKWFTESANGKKKDVLVDFLKVNACAASMIYNFNSEGKIIPEGSKCPKSVENEFRGTWKVQGKKIILGVSDPGIEPQTYDLEFSGNVMRITMIFDDEDSDKADNVKRYVMEYTKV